MAKKKDFIRWTDALDAALTDSYGEEIGAETAYTLEGFVTTFHTEDEALEKEIYAFIKGFMVMHELKFIYGIEVTE